MNDKLQQILDRIDALKGKLSDRYISLEATGKPDIIRDMRRGRMPSGDKLDQIAEVLRTTTDHLLGKSDHVVKPSPFRQEPTRAEMPRMGFAAEAVREDIPVYGTALGADLPIDEDAADPVLIEQTMLYETQEIGRARRMPGIADRRDIYAVYIVGNSMERRYQPGDLVYVDPHQPPKSGDDVIVQLTRANGDDADYIASLVKRFVRHTPHYVELEQFQPEHIFRVPREDVRRMHRIVPLRELAGL